MQIKTTIKYHLTWVRMASIKKTRKKKTRNNKCRQGCGEKGALVQCWWECKLVQSLGKTVWRSLKKLKIEIPYNSIIPLLGTYPKKTKTLIKKDIWTMFTAALFTIAKTWKQSKHLSIDEWIKKMWYLYIYISLFFFNVYLFWERERVQVEGGREKMLSRLHTVSTEPNMGLDPANCKIMT